MEHPKTFRLQDSTLSLNMLRQRSERKLKNLGFCKNRLFESWARWTDWMIWPHFLALGKWVRSSQCLPNIFWHRSPHKFSQGRLDILWHSFWDIFVQGGQHIFWHGSARNVLQGCFNIFWLGLRTLCLWQYPPNIFKKKFFHKFCQDSFNVLWHNSLDLFFNDLTRYVNKVPLTSFCKVVLKKFANP